MTSPGPSGYLLSSKEGGPKPKRRACGAVWPPSTPEGPRKRVRCRTASYAFYIAIRSWPVLTENPTLDTIRTVAEWLFTGLAQLTRTDTDKDEKSEMVNVGQLDARTTLESPD